MAIPELSMEQRKAALAKAAALRKQRSELLHQMKSGQLTFLDMINRKDEVVGRIKVRSLLKAIPGIGNVYADEVMGNIRIAADRRVMGLGCRQRSEIIAWYEQYAKLNLES
jgi:formamidopyrimidine-DNA glycosylase